MQMDAQYSRQLMKNSAQPNDQENQEEEKKHHGRED